MSAKRSAVDPWAEAQWSYMESKLVGAGCTPGEIEDFHVQWVDPSWDHDDKLRVLALGDGKLRAELDAARSDAVRDTMTEEEEAAMADEAVKSEAMAALRAEAEEQSAYDVNEIIEWVGDNRERAVAMLVVEEAAGQPRADLVAVLEQLLHA